MDTGFQDLVAAQLHFKAPRYVYRGLAAAELVLYQIGPLGNLLRVVLSNPVLGKSSWLVSALITCTSGYLRPTTGALSLPCYSITSHTTTRLYSGRLFECYLDIYVCEGITLFLRGCSLPAIMQEAKHFKAHS